MKIIRKLSNILGWSTNKRIVVIESDDWGSIRMPSLNVFRKLNSKGIDLLSNDAQRYNENDSIASSDDLMFLFDVLKKFKDKFNRSAVFTPVSLVANPDFEKIKASGFEKYFYEPITTSFKKQKGCENVLSLWKEGIEQRLFIPEFHGREHLNVCTWMRALKANDKTTHLAFESGFWGFKNKHSHNVEYQAAFETDKIEDLKEQEIIINEGLQLFYEIFGYKASYFMPPNGIINNKLELTLLKNGINYIGSSKIQTESLGDGKKKTHFRYLGRRNSIGQFYIIRNAVFEPSQSGKDWVSSCLSDISIAFRMHKPAIISTHRVNYIGSLNPANRDNGLKQLSQLLKEITKRWPDVEFMTSAELGDLIASSRK